MNLSRRSRARYLCFCAFVLASVVAQAKQCSIGCGCPSDNDLKNDVSLLQAKIQMSVLKDGGEEDMEGADDGFTIVVNTFQRDMCLKKVLDHWLQCRPRQIRVVWNDVGREVPDYLESLAQSSQGLIVFKKPSTKNLTNRFLPDDFSTAAVFSVDEDLVYPCDEVWGAYWIWHKHPRQMVGFAPRILSRDGYSWDGSYNHWGSNQANALFLTKGGFTHKRYFHALFSSRFGSFRDEVNKHTTGEDMLLSFVQAVAEPDQKPIPILSYAHHDVACDSPCQKAPLGTLTADHRPLLLRRLFDELGNVLPMAQFEDFYFWDVDVNEPRNIGLANYSRTCLETFSRTRRDFYEI